MNPKIFLVLSGLFAAAAFVMFAIGSTNSHLTELKDFFWVPIPLSVIFDVLYIMKKKSQTKNNPPGV